MDPAGFSCLRTKILNVTTEIDHIWFRQFSNRLIQKTFLQSVVEVI